MAKQTVAHSLKLQLHCTTDKFTSNAFTGFPLDLENLEKDESTPGKPGNIMEFWKNLR